ncbi:MAG: class I SAM-dependent methyltransferase [Nitrososphaeraceae archaeon]
MIEREFPDWDNLYKNQKVETMPWYNKALDEDLRRELERRHIKEGTFLDLGTGPATQAFQLANMGFRVKASDISEAAIIAARKIMSEKRNDNTKHVDFIVDDILNSKINDNEFDYIFDRGCFHVLPINKRLTYIIEVNKKLKYDGLLFLKVFSDKELRNDGPYKFSENEIRDIFERESFQIESIDKCVFQGNLLPLPKALFVTMMKI